MDKQDVLRDFNAFISSNLPRLIAEPHCVYQLASQQPHTSSVHQAWEAFSAASSAHRLNHNNNGGDAHNGGVDRVLQRLNQYCEAMPSAQQRTPSADAPALQELPLLSVYQQPSQRRITAVSAHVHPDDGRLFIAVGAHDGTVSLLQWVGAAGGNERGGGGGMLIHKWSVAHTPQNPPSTCDIVTDITERIQALAFFYRRDGGTSGDHGSASDDGAGPSRVLPALTLASVADINVRFWDVSSEQTSAVEVLGTGLPGHVHVTNPGGGQEAKGPPAEGPCQCKHYLLEGLWKKNRSGYCTEIGHSSQINCIAFNNDNTKLVGGTAAAPRVLLCATGDDYRVIKIWDVMNQLELFQLYGHSTGVESVAFGSDTRTLFSVAGDKSVLVWRWSWAGDAMTLPRLRATHILTYGAGACVTAAPSPWPSQHGMVMAAASNASYTTNSECCVVDVDALLVGDELDTARPVQAAVVDRITQQVARAKLEEDGSELFPAELPAGGLAALIAADTSLPLATYIKRDGVLKTAEDIIKLKEIYLCEKTHGVSRLEDGGMVGEEDAKAKEEVEELKSKYKAEVVHAYDFEVSEGIGFKIVSIFSSSSSEKGRHLITTYKSPPQGYRAVRSHVTSGPTKLGPPPCTCKSDLGDLVADPTCPVRGHSDYCNSITLMVEPSAHHRDVLLMCTSTAKEVMLWRAHRTGEVQPRSVLKNPLGGRSVSGSTLVSPLRDGKRSSSNSDAASCVLLAWSSEELKLWHVRPWQKGVVSGRADPKPNLPPPAMDHAGRVTRLEAVVHPSTLSVTVASCARSDVTAGLWSLNFEVDLHGSEVAMSLASYPMRRALAGHGKQVSCCALSPDGLLLATGSEDSRVRVFRASDGKMLHEWYHVGKTSSDDGVSDVAWDPVYGVSSYTLASATNDGNSLCFWHVDVNPNIPPAADLAQLDMASWCTSTSNEYSKARELVKQDPVLEAAVSNVLGYFQAQGAVTGSFLYAFGFDASHRDVFDVDVMEGDRKCATRLTKPEVGKLTHVYRASHDRHVQVTHKESGAVVLKIPFPLVICIQGHDYWDIGCTCAWQAEEEDAKSKQKYSGKCSLPGHSWGICSVLYSPDGKAILTTALDQTVKIWVPTRGGTSGGANSPHLYDSVRYAASLEGFGDSSKARWISMGRSESGPAFTGIVTGASSWNDNHKSRDEVLGVWSIAGCLGATTTSSVASSCSYPKVKELVLPNKCVVQDMCCSADGMYFAVAATPTSRSLQDSFICVYRSQSHALSQWQQWKAVAEDPYLKNDEAAANGGGGSRQEELTGICFLRPLGSPSSSNSEDQAGLQRRQLQYVATTSNIGTCRVWCVNSTHCIRVFYASSPLKCVATVCVASSSSSLPATQHQDVQIASTNIGVSATTTTTSTDNYLLCAGAESGGVFILHAANLIEDVPPSADQQRLIVCSSPSPSDAGTHGKSTGPDGSNGTAVVEGFFDNVRRLICAPEAHNILQEIEKLCLGLTNRALEAIRKGDDAHDDAHDDDVNRMCVICLSARRSVRFSCGHCICCEACGGQWRRMTGSCPACRAQVSVVQMGLKRLNPAAYEAR